MDTKSGDEAQDTLIAVIPKNAREELRLTLGEYRGYPLAQLRVWFKGDDGAVRPSKSGVAFRVSLLRDITEAFHQALEHARRDGRI